MTFSLGFLLFASESFSDTLDSVSAVYDVFDKPMPITEDSVRPLMNLFRSSLKSTFQKLQVWVHLSRWVGQVRAKSLRWEMKNKLSLVAANLGWNSSLFLSDFDQLSFYYVEPESSTSMKIPYFLRTSREYLTFATCFCNDPLSTVTGGCNRSDLVPRWVRLDYRLC
jgi:hypothetical protein